MENLPIGTLQTCFLKEPGFINENWIVCDGTEYDNSDNKFNALLEMEIGFKFDNVFKSPDYRSMNFVNCNRLTNEMNRDKCKKLENYGGHYHCKNDYFNNVKSVLFYKREIVDFVNNRDETSENEKANICWIIKYKL